MEVLATETEQLIKDTAKKVFFAQGRLHATTQEIADAAGINRASIHYYFRSRQLLFDKVFNEAISEMRSKLKTVFDEELSFRDRTERFIDIFIKKSIEHPYLEMFIITEFNTNSNVKIMMIRSPDEKNRMEELGEKIDEEVAAGKMKPISAQHFMITVMSLCSFPFLAQDIFKSVLSLDNAAYTKLIQERKEVIIKLLFLDA